MSHWTIRNEERQQRLAAKLERYFDVSRQFEVVVLLLLRFGGKGYRENKE